MGAGSAYRVPDGVGTDRASRGDTINGQLTGIAPLELLLAGATEAFLPSIELGERDGSTQMGISLRA